MGGRLGAALALASLLSLGWCALVAPGARAEPLARERVPEPLRPWVDWALRGHEQRACPFLQGDASARAGGPEGGPAEPATRECAWPARLELEAGGSGASFRQEWQLFHETFVPLPGDARHWPETVRAGGAELAVVARAGVPSVRLPAGRHELSGRIAWSELPERLAVPAATGLVRLVLAGNAVPAPERDAEGRLWLRREASRTDEESRLELVVLRRLVDEAPFQVETRLELRASGAPREVLLGRALLEGFVPMSLESGLPARLESDGRLRLQVRPGTWQVALSARRNEAPPADLGPGDPGGPWAPHEVWVFAARPQLRVVQVEGVPAIDPQQTRLPAEWRALPAYLVKPGDRLQLVEKRRGDSDPAPDRLTLARTLWLDFDGGGFTAHDEIRGTLRRGFRLEVLPGTELGRVAVDGEDQLVTRRAGSQSAGFEIRQGEIQVDADLRLPRAGALPAVGWDQDFQEVSGALHLPPGWRLLHASGVDRAEATWTSRWSLFEIFLVLVTAMAVAHLFGAVWGVLALAVLALTYPEPGAPRWSWLAVVGVEALLRVVPAGLLRAGLRAARLAALVALLVVAVPFAVSQTRVALSVALEQPGRAPAPPRAPVLDEAVPASEPVLKGQVLADSYEGRGAPLRARVVRAYTPDPTARVSTGPGLPRWQWRTVALAFDGPVLRDQTLRLRLAPPWASRLLALVCALGTALLAVGVAGLGARLAALGGVGRRLGPGAGLALALLGGGGADARAELPPPELLAELRERLLAPPACFPECAASPHLELDATPERLVLRLEVAALARSAIPLPGALRAWTPASVSVDGAPARALRRDAGGRLWLVVEAGQHRVVLEGALPDTALVQIPLPLAPRRVSARVRGWTLDGVARDGSVAESLQLTRLAQAGTDSLEPSALPPFVEVSRTLRLDLAWRVDTVVTRATPPGQAVFLRVPLLPGEAPTSEALRVEDGHALVELGPGEMRLEWSSLLEPVAELVLRASEPQAFAERWRLDVSPLWHVEASGIPPLHPESAELARLREWRPWPGESVALAIARPAGVEGATLTLDGARLHVRPGRRASDASLALSLRASRGGSHALELGPEAELLGVSVDGAPRPIRATDGRVVLPIEPGSHEVVLDWRSPAAIALRFATPAVALGMPAVNNEVRLSVPEDRWVLFVGGPRLGPTVLFWALLATAAVLSFGLARLGGTPLGAAAWFLLLVGLSQVHVAVALLVVGWLLALGVRRRRVLEPRGAFLAGQLLLAGWTFVALLGLLFAVQQGLLGHPDMQIAGNGSTGRELVWYLDRSAGELARARVVSVPIWLYRLAMLAWALWLARALVGWLRWGWQSFSQGGYWRSSPRVEPA